MNNMNLYSYDKTITYNAYCDIDGKRYFSSNIVNGLFELDLETGKTEFVLKFERIIYNMANIHRVAFKWNDKIVFSPFRYDRVAIYDPVSKDIKYIVVSNHIMFAQGAYLEGDILWIFGGYKSDTFVSVNLVNGEVWSSASLAEIIKDKAEIASVYVINSNVYVDNCKAYAAISGTGCIIEFDLHSKEFTIINLNDSEIKLSSLAVADNNLYLTAYCEKDVYKYNILSKDLTRIKCNIEVKADIENSYCVIASTPIGILLFPQKDKKILLVGKNDEIIEFIGYPANFYEVKDDFRKQWRKILRIDISENSVHITPFRIAMEMVIDLEERTISGKRYEFDEEFIEEIFRREYKPEFIAEENKKDMIYESGMYRLSDYINQI